MDHVHWFGWSGWRWMLVLEGLPAVLGGVVCYLYVADLFRLPVRQSGRLRRPLRYRSDQGAGLRGDNRLAVVGSLAGDVLFHDRIHLCPGTRPFCMIR